MKKFLGSLSALTLMLNALCSSACADVAIPGRVASRSAMNDNSSVLVLLIALALIVIAVLIWKIRSLKK